MANTPQEYYNDNTEWGQYQYVSLESVITDLKASGVTNKHINFLPRTDLVRYGKLAIREFNLDVVQQVKAIELELGANLNLVLPSDYIQYVRVSYIDDNGILQPIAQSNDLLIAKSYLQDNDGNILFDNEGNILATDLTDTFKNGNNQDRQVLYGYSFAPNTNLTKSNPNKFRLDRERGLIQFNSSVEGKNIVLEYVSDGLNNVFNTLDESDIKINKILEEALIDAIYYKCIKMNSEVPDYEKRRAQKEYYNSKRLAKRKINTLRRDELIQAFSGATKWV